MTVVVADKTSQPVIETLKATENIVTDQHRRYRGFWILGEVLLWMTTWSRRDLNKAGLDYMREVASVAHNIPDALENTFYDLKNLDADVMRLHKLVFQHREPPEKFLVQPKFTAPLPEPLPWVAIRGYMLGLVAGIPLGVYIAKMM